MQEYMQSQTEHANQKLGRKINIWKLIDSHDAETHPHSQNKVWKLLPLPVFTSRIPLNRMDTLANIMSEYYNTMRDNLFNSFVLGGRKPVPVGNSGCTSVWNDQIILVALKPKQRCTFYALWKIEKCFRAWLHFMKKDDCCHAIIQEPVWTPAMCWNISRTAWMHVCFQPKVHPHLLCSFS